MKTVLRLKRIFCAAFLLAAAMSSSHAQNSKFSFINPVLSSLPGTELKLGSVYRFDNVVSGAYALVTIDSLINGATVENIDDNGSGVGYLEAFQPRVTVPGNALGILHEAYVVFKINFYRTSNNAALTMTNLIASAIDIDGGPTFKEMAEINMEGGTLSYYSGTLDIAITNILNVLGSRYRADDILGIERTGIDTASLGNMFTVTKSNVSSFKVKYGGLSTETSASTRQYSMYLKGVNGLNTLPVSLVSFSASYNKTKVDLKWSTATEINVSHFVVEKSLDGKNYSDAGIVFAYGNTTDKKEYSFSDNINADQVNVVYYRLRSVDLDGKAQYSDIKIIRTSKQAENNISIITYPNPVMTELRITIPAAWQNKKVTYELINNNGQVIKRTETSSSSQTETINVTNIQPGSYFVIVKCNGETAQQKIVKQ